MQKESFVFKKSWLLAIEGYASNVRCEFYEAVFAYLSCGRTVDLVSGGAKRAFASVKKDIDLYNAVVDKQQHISDVRREAQKKSVEARKSNKDGFAKIANANFANFANKSDFSHSNTCIDNINNQDNINNKKIEDKKESGEKETKKKLTADSNVNSTADGHKGRTLQSRRDEFEKSLEPYVAVYGREMVQKFFSYWSEANKSQTKMRWELQKTWETPRRLRTWASRENLFNGNSNYGNKNYGNQQPTIDPRRGTPARQHTLEEFLAQD